MIHLTLRRWNRDINKWVSKGCQIDHSPSDVNQTTCWRIHSVLEIQLWRASRTEQVGSASTAHGGCGVVVNP